MTEIALDDALFGEILSPRVQQIIRLERQADDAQWEAARLIAEELAEGKSQRQLAREIGKSQAHVFRMNRCWALRETLGFHILNEAYHSPEVRGKHDPELSAAEPQDIEQPPLLEPEPERVLPPCEACGEPNPDHFEHTICPDCDTERSGYQAEPEPEPMLDDDPQLTSGFSGRHSESGPGWSNHGGRWHPNPAKTLSDEHREKLDRLRQMANDIEHENPSDPIRELLDLQGALQRAIPKMRALKAARQVITADALTARIARLCKEMEELL